MRPAEKQLYLIITTRSAAKSFRTIDHLRRYIAKSQDLASQADRVTIQAELVDLLRLFDVQELAKRLLSTVPRIDTAIWNAGIAGVTGIDWMTAIWATMTEFTSSVTWPTFMLSGIGSVAKPQLVSSTGNAADADSNMSTALEEPPLGEIFCANVFSHYLLGHYLLPLLSQPAFSHLGRMIWISSVEVRADSFVPSDPQSLKTSAAYQSSKRLTDILALSPMLSSYTTVPTAVSMPAQKKGKASSLPAPRMYLTHPGVASTNIVLIPLVAFYAKIIAFYLARLIFGSPWHTISPYKGACAPVWVALASQSTLDRIEEQDGKGKWGSCTDRWGNERVMRTEVEGWAMEVW
jgi:3-keto steroid reductase